MTRFLSVADIVFIHRQTLLDHRQSAAVVDQRKVEAAAARPASSAGGVDAYGSVAEKAAALMQSLVVGHPFTDGNKRAGLACALVFLKLNGVETDADQDALYDLTMDIATGVEHEINAIAKRIAILFALAE